MNETEKQAATKKAQEFLNKYGYTDSEGLKLKEDGKRGPKTEYAFDNFKKLNGESAETTTETPPTLRFKRDPDNPTNIYPVYDGAEYSGTDYKVEALANNNKYYYDKSLKVAETQNNYKTEKYKDNLIIYTRRKNEVEQYTNIVKNGKLIDLSPIAYAIYQLIKYKSKYIRLNHNSSSESQLQTTANVGRFCKAVIKNCKNAYGASGPYQDVIQKALDDETDYSKDSISTWLNVLNEILQDSEDLSVFSLEGSQNNITVNFITNNINKLNKGQTEFRNYGFLNPKDDKYAPNMDHAPIYYYPESGELVLQNIPVDLYTFEPKKDEDLREKIEKAKIK